MDERQKDRQMRDRNIARWIDRKIAKWIDRRIAKWIDRKIAKWIDRKIARAQMDRQKNRWTKYLPLIDLEI